MKQYRFVGDPDNWGWEPRLINGHVYDANYSAWEHEGEKITVESVFKDRSMKGFQDWEEAPNDL